MTAIAAAIAPASAGPTGLPTSAPDFIRAQPGPLLFADLEQGPGLPAHRARVGPVPALHLEQLLALADSAAVSGRGGAGFPFGVKLRTAAAAGRRREVVVNLAEGEPASAKDSALALYAPHRILDGAALTATALGVRRIHVVVPGDRPAVRDALEVAVAERAAAGERLRWQVAVAEPRFVAGQARAVLELLEGRAGLPVTAWAPEARSGLRGRPTLLANAETWAHVGLLGQLGQSRYAALGTPTEPGTTLLTLTCTPGTVASEEAGAADPPGTALVVEVPYGTPWPVVLGDQVDGAVLVGGYHGVWATPGQLRGLTVSRTGMQEAGLVLGAGVVLVAGQCPVALTGEIAAYLSGERAGRCGPCVHGLPALAAEAALLGAADPAVSYSRLVQLSSATGVLTGRGACAHPDGTARVVASALRAFEAEVTAHLGGTCTWRRS